MVKLNVSNNKFYNIVLFSLLLSAVLYSFAQEPLLTFPSRHRFFYDLGIKVIPSKSSSTAVTICCHGYGHNNQIVDVINSYNVFTENLIGFNFPDYNIKSTADHREVAYGTIDEILPLLYILKYCVCDLQISKINLYGFSAGGAAIINALGVLNNSYHDRMLEEIGIFVEEKKRILNIIEQGYIILDCPLKSIGEIIAFRGNSPELKILAENYSNNVMNPIYSVYLLSGMKLNIMLHFQDPDEILSNRDDALFISRLIQINKGLTIVTTGSDRGHVGYHSALWSEYKKIKR